MIKASILILRLIIFLTWMGMFLVKHPTVTSQLIRFARVSSHITDFNTQNKLLSAKLLNQDYRYHKLCEAFSKFYRRHFNLVSKFHVGLKCLLQQGLSEPEFYGDLVYRIRKIYACNDFSTQFRKTILRYIKIGYNINVIRQTAYIVVNPIKVNNFASLFGCTSAGRASVYDGSGLQTFK